MTAGRKKRKLTAQDFRAVEALMHDDDLFDGIQTSLDVVVTPRIRHYIANELRMHAGRNCRGPGRSEITAARHRFVKIINAFLDDIGEFRKSPDPAMRLAWRDFFMVCEVKYHPDDIVIRSGLPEPEGLSDLEHELLEFLEFAEIRRSTKRGQPRKNREGIFCALYLAFRAAGGNPSANWSDATNNIEGKFVRFASMIIDQCPDFLKEDLQTGLAGALRTQLKEWRRSPSAPGAPGYTLGEATLWYLRASPDVVIRPAVGQRERFWSVDVTPVRATPYAKRR